MRPQSDWCVNEGNDTLNDSAFVLTECADHCVYVRSGTLGGMDKNNRCEYNDSYILECSEMPKIGQAGSISRTDQCHGLKSHCSE